MNRKADIYFGSKLAGVLEETDESYIFAYSREYLTAPEILPISLNLPLRKEP